MNRIEKVSHPMTQHNICLQKNGEEALFTKVSFNSVLHCIPKSCVNHFKINQILEEWNDYGMRLTKMF